MSNPIELSSLLIDIEAELRQLNLWQSEPLSAEALESTEPFYIDTLTFPQWLQFVFLVRISSLIERQQALPSNCSIAPMAEEYFKGAGLSASQLVAVIENLDRLLSN